jgi:hypothetical protein
LGNGYSRHNSPGEIGVIIERIDAAIAGFEQLPNVNSGKSSRGRKSMGSEERQQVSERMKPYWASRRRTSDMDLALVTAARSG